MQKSLELTDEKMEQAIFTLDRTTGKMKYKYEYAYWSLFVLGNHFGY